MSSINNINYISNRNGEFKKKDDEDNNENNNLKNESLFPQKKKVPYGLAKKGGMPPGQKKKIDDNEDLQETNNSVIINPQNEQDKIAAAQKQAQEELLQKLQALKPMQNQTVQGLQQITQMQSNPENNIYKGLANQSIQNINANDVISRLNNLPIGHDPTPFVKLEQAMGNYPVNSDFFSPRQALDTTALNAQYNKQLENIQAGVNLIEDVRGMAFTSFVENNYPKETQNFLLNQR